MESDSSYIEHIDAKTTKQVESYEKQEHTQSIIKSASSSNSNINNNSDSIFLKEKISSVNNTPIKSNLSKVLKDNHISPKIKFNDTPELKPRNFNIEGDIIKLRAADSPNNIDENSNSPNNKPLSCASNLIKSKRFSTVSNVQGFQCTIYLSETLGGSSKHSIKMFIRHDWSISRAIDETIKLAYEKYDITITQEIDQLCLYVADEDGTIDSDYPVLDNEQIVSNTGINGFVLSTKLLVKQLSLNIGDIKRIEEGSTSKSLTLQCCWF